MKLSNGRSWSNDRLKHIAKSLPNFEHAINVSGNLDSDKQGGLYRDYFQVENYEISSYPDDKAYSNPLMQINIDLDADTSQINKEHFQKYDLVFTHTVLEHIKNPFQAFQNMEKLLAPNGILITVAPFIYKFHYSGENFGDYWRYTPHSIDLLHKSNGLFTNLMEVGPDKGYEKYLISLATRKNEITNFSFDEEDFSKWNHSLGDNSYNLLIRYLKNRIFDSIKIRNPIKLFGRQG
jgi:SAM-dependent methyltransferase